jgi:CBS domain-containing protein
MKGRDVMTPKVISIGADESVLKAARLMLQNHISGLPVLDKEGELVGIVTEGDFLRRGELDYPKTNIVRVGLNYQFH